MLLANTDYFLSTKPAYPWSEYPLGPPALALVAAALVGLTLWTYFNHPAATRKRVFVVLSLRLAALVVALLTALRPSLGIQEDPKIPSVLLVGIDMSESMTIKDEFNNLTRIDAVRRILDKCEPVLDELRTEQNVNVVFYGFGPPDFNEAANKYDPKARADFKRSDYGTYLSRTLDRWQTERFVRAHLVVGDGIDNGTSLSAVGEAGRWRAVCPVHTFAVGSSTTPPEAKDVAVAAVAADPSPVPVKNDVTIKVVVNAYGFVGAKVPVVVSFDGVQKAKEEVVLTKAAGNEIPITVKAPEKPGEVKVRVEIPIDSVPGDTAPANNVVETYLTVTKEGVRVLLVDRLRPENAMLRRVLGAERRFDVEQVLRQPGDPPTADERRLFDFDANGYDVIILGNVSAAQLQAVDPDLPRKLRDQVAEKGTGLLMTGGDATFAGNPNQPDTGWRGTALEDLLPVSLDPIATLPDDLFRGESNRFQTVPTLEGIRFLMKVGATEEASKTLWDRLNDAKPFCRLTALSRFGVPKPDATVYAVAAAGKPEPAGVLRADQAREKPPFLLVGRQVQGGNKGRVLAFAGYDTYLWKPFGMRERPPTREGAEIHAQFWRRLVLWLAHQEEEEGAAYIRPEFRRLPVHGKQSIKIGLRQPGGAEAIDAKYEVVKVVGPGRKPEDVGNQPQIADPAGGAKVRFEPPLPGEYTVVLKATGKDAAGKDVKGEATARFLAYADVSDEMLRTATERDHLEKLAQAGGGKAYTLEDLPGFLKELKGQPIELAKKPRFVPDWRRNHSKGFLPAWLVVFVALVGTEWALRRLWGMA